MQIERDEKRIASMVGEFTTKDFQQTHGLCIVYARQIIKTLYDKGRLKRTKRENCFYYERVGDSSDFLWHNPFKINIPETEVRSQSPSFNNIFNLR